MEDNQKISLDKIKSDIDIEDIFRNGYLDPAEDLVELEPVIVQRNNGYESILSTLGNFSLVIGKAKSRKSFLMAILIAVCGLEDSLFNLHSRLQKDKQNLLYFDTEQGKRHVQLAFRRMCTLVGFESPDFIKVYPLRKYSTKERLEIIEYSIYNTPLLGVVVIDGIRDLITSINDEEQATMIANKLMKWSEDLNIHIYVVLHQNKSDNNARGHAGTELMNKAETVISVTKSEGDNKISIVDTIMSRNKEPEPFAFEIIDDLPSLVEDFEVRSTVKPSSIDFSKIENHKYFSMLNAIFSREEELRYGKLVLEIKYEFEETFDKSIGDNSAKKLLTRFKNKGWILQRKGKGGVYTLGNYTEE
ncbi:AAA family ATPase [Winogradskyella sp. HB-48]|uniref:AAA family ATPase n=1 Tax=Winogradskyella sp. HB-48 TaxID=3416808 RepID=UPI003CECA42B